MSAYSSFSSDSSELTRLRRDLSSLQEELTQCKADKEFVWSLWRRLQVANPDVTQAIGHVLQREKDKWDHKEKELMETVFHRNGCIDELKRTIAKQTDDITELVASKLAVQKLADEFQSQLEKVQLENSSLRHQLESLESKARDTASREMVRELDQRNLELKQQLNVKEAEVDKLQKARDDAAILMESQKRQLLNLQEDTRLMEDKSKNLKADNHRLQQLIKHCEQEMENQKFVIDSKDREMESLRRELSDLWQTHQQSVEHSSHQSQLIKQLQQLHSDTQNMLRSQEEAFTVELAAHQCKVHDLELVISSLTNAGKSSHNHHTSLVSSNSQSEDSVTEGRIVSLEREMTELRKKVPNTSERTCRELRPCVSDVIDYAATVSDQPCKLDQRKTKPRSRSLTSADRRTVVPDDRQQQHDINILRQKLGSAERHVKGLQDALTAKNNELEMVQTAHSRRLERLRSVITSYQLVKQQLKLYEDDYMCAKKKKKPINHRPPSRVAGKQLQKENNDVVWNELAFFKKENKSLKIENFKLKEECDQLQVKLASDEATVHELRCQLHEQTEEAKLAHEELDHVRQQCVDSTKHKVDIAKAQLDRVCRELGATREEVHQLTSDKDDLLLEKRALLADLVDFQKRESKHRIDICNLKKEVFRLQRKLRRKPVHSSHTTKHSVQLNWLSVELDELGAELEKACGKTLGKPRSASNDRMGSHHGNELWEDIAASSDGDSEIDRPVSSELSHITTTNTSGSLGEAIVSEARSRGATGHKLTVGSSLQSPAQTQKELGQNLCREPTRTSTPTLSSGTPQNILSNKQKQLIKEYVRELTKQISSAVDATRQPFGDGNVPAVTTTQPSTSRSVSALKQRVAGLQHQVTVLKLAKEAALRSRNEQQKESEMLSEQLHTANQRLISCRQQAQRTATELEKVRSEKESLEAKMAEYSFDTSVCSTAGKGEQDVINNLQSRLKMSTASLSKQLENNKQLKSENEKQAEKLAQQSERKKSAQRAVPERALSGVTLEERRRFRSAKLRISHLERDLAQKRVLMDDVKLKLTIAQENAEADADVMLEVEAKLKSLNEHNGRLKTQIECLKSRLTAVAREKFQCDATVSKLTEEIDRKTKLVSELQKRLSDTQSRLTDVEKSAEEHMRTLALHTESAIDTAQERLGAADVRLKEHLKFVKVFAYTLLNSVKQIRSLRQMTSAKMTSDKASTTTAKAAVDRSPFAASLPGRAQTTLSDKANISQSNLSDLLALSFASEDAVDTCVSAKDTLWAKKCEALLQSEVSFALGLVDLFMEKIDERCKLTAELNTARQDKTVL